ncbi:MAG: RNA polymerase sigma factor [Acidimicrobiales bacterium]
MVQTVRCDDALADALTDAVADADALADADAGADADEVRAVQAGSTDAFAALYRRHYPSVHRATLGVLRDAVDAEEAAQAAFVRAFERIDQCGGERRFGPWVHVIARRLCLDTLRARARTQPECRPVAEERPSPARGDPEESILRREEVRSLQAALSTLSTRQRQAVIARAVDDQPPSEIAASLGLSTSAVDSLLLRARRRLRKARTIAH